MFAISALANLGSEKEPKPKPWEKNPERFRGNPFEKSGRVEQMMNRKSASRNIHEEFEDIEKDMKDLLHSLDVQKETELDRRCHKDGPNANELGRYVVKPFQTLQSQPGKEWNSPPPIQFQKREPVISKHSNWPRYPANQRAFEPVRRRAQSHQSSPEVNRQIGFRKADEKSLSELSEFQRRLELFGLDDVTNNSSNSRFPMRAQGVMTSTSVASPSYEMTQLSDFGGFDTSFGSEEEHNREKGVYHWDHTISEATPSYTVKDRKRVNKASQLSRQTASVSPINSLRMSPQRNRLIGSRNSVLSNNSGVESPLFRSRDNTSGTVISDSISLVGSNYGADNQSRRDSSSASSFSNEASVVNYSASSKYKPILGDNFAPKYRSQSVLSMTNSLQPGEPFVKTCVVCKEPIFEQNEGKATRKWVHQECSNLVCPVCSKVVFCMEEVCVEGQSYHHWCCKCQSCGRSLTSGNINTWSCNWSEKRLERSHWLLCEYCLRQETKREHQMCNSSDGRPSVDGAQNKMTRSTSAEVITPKSPVPYQKFKGAKSVGSYNSRPYNSLARSTISTPNRRSLGSVFQADVIPYDRVPFKPSSWKSTSQIHSPEVLPTFKRNQNLLKSQSQLEQQQKPLHNCVVCEEPILWDQSRDVIRENQYAHWSCIRQVCPVCSARVHPFDGWSSHGRMYHKLCFKCNSCGSPIAKGSETVQKDRAGVRRLYHHCCITTTILKNWT